MNRYFLQALFSTLASSALSPLLQAQDVDKGIQDVLNKKLPEKKKKLGRTKAKKLSFDFDATDLTAIINMIAAEKNINIILPMGAQVINAKVTLHMENKLTLEEAWELLHTLLSAAGYSLLQKDNVYTIVKLSPTITREPAPIFVGTEPTQLPNFEKRISYIYYLSYIKVPKTGAEAQSELDGILKELLPATALIKYEPFTNALILNENASIIRSAMSVIKELDKPGFQEAFEIIRLKYTQAELVADLFNKSILAATDPKMRLTARKPNEGLYFSQETRIIPEPRNNNLFVFGPRQAIDRVRDFIVHYIDVELGTGKSILHTYQLQYLEADSFAAVLTNIVQSAATGGTGQSKAGAGTTGGVERFFEDVVITTDKPTRKGSGQETEYFGGNKLIVAARSDDWERIKKIIEQLDSPQPQVIIEVLIADLTINDDRLLGSIMRNPKAIPLPKISDSIRNVEFQSTQLGEVATSLQVPALPPAQSSIAVDLAKFNNSRGSVNIPGQLDVGSTAITISDNDGSIWNILQVLQSYGQTKILSNPHVIATNNKKAMVSIGEKRLVAGEAVGSAGGATTAKQTYVDAKLDVYITPRISSAKTINITLDININEFVSSALSNANQNTRKIKTNANVLSGDILALGGLIKVNSAVDQSEVPFLGKIPILGWFLKRRRGTNDKNNLTVFIRPTVIEPRLRSGIGDYTKDYIDLAHGYVKEGSLFDTMRDPITRWFFKTTDDTDKDISRFLRQHESSEKKFDASKGGDQSNQSAENEAKKEIALNLDKTSINEKEQFDLAMLDHERSEKIRKLLANEESPLTTDKQVTRKPILNS